MRPVRRRILPARSGFTLFELILVLFLAGLLTAMVLPSFSATLASARFRGGAMEVRAVLALARTLAASQSRMQAVAISPRTGTFGVAGEGEHALPEGVSFSAVFPEAAPGAGDRVQIRFYPDGSADEAVIDLASADGGRLRVIVDPLTGIAEVRS